MNTRTAPPSLSLITTLASVALALSLSPLGCASPLANVTPPTLPGPAAAPCELRLYIEHHEDSEMLQAFDPQDRVYGACIKRQGEELQLPADIYLASHNIEPYLATRSHWSSSCQGHKKADGQVTITGEARASDYCVWNHTYRSWRPFSLRVRAEFGTKLKDHMTLLRVFENGRLAYLWNHDSEAVDISIPSPLLRDNGLPFDAPLDLRIIPAGIAVDDGLLSQQVKEVHSRTEQALRIVGETVLSEVVTADPALKAAFECYNWQLRDISRQVRSLAASGSLPPAAAPPAACTALRLSTAASPKPSDLYARARTEGARALSDAQQKVDAHLGAMSHDAQSAVHAARQDLDNKFLTWKAAAPGAAAVRNAEQQVKRLMLLGDQVVGLAEELKLSYGQLSQRLDALKGDRAEQARVLGRVAEKLEASGSPFQPIVVNPPLAAGEKDLRMTYREHIQGYLFAPWNAVPIKTRGDDVGAQVSSANLIPVLDVGGARWQWGQSRFAEFRMGAGVMYYADKNEKEVKQETSTPATGDSTTTTTSVGKDQFRFGLQGNISVGTLRLGVVFPVGDGTKVFQEQWRLLLGLDLVKRQFDGERPDSRTKRPLVLGSEVTTHPSPAPEAGHHGNRVVLRPRRLFLSLRSQGSRPHLAA